MSGWAQIKQNFSVERALSSELQRSLILDKRWFRAWSIATHGNEVRAEQNTYRLTRQLIFLTKYVAP
jgi:hypothetical protein